MPNEVRKRWYFFSNWPILNPILCRTLSNPLVLVSRATAGREIRNETATTDWREIDHFGRRGGQRPIAIRGVFRFRWWLPIWWGNLLPKFVVLTSLYVSSNSFSSHSCPLKSGTIFWACSFLVPMFWYHSSLLGAYLSVCFSQCAVPLNSLRNRTTSQT